LRYQEKQQNGSPTFEFKSRNHIARQNSDKNRTDSRNAGNNEGIHHITPEVPLPKHFLIIHQRRGFRKILYRKSVDFSLRRFQGSHQHPKKRKDDNNQIDSQNNEFDCRKNPAFYFSRFHRLILQFAELGNGKIDNRKDSQE